ncbi:YciI family protein [Flavobacterium sp. 3HN19-14]|uniref:YciI family protein n=1 Tax=Flavobacterium sp. 3HN19-14 TaxID=3448133 RepID=UPI003EE07797
MKKLLYISLLLLVFSGVKAQTDNPKYDKALAESLGADEYGMKAYVLVILKTGSNTTQDKEKRNTLFRGHMDNIGRLATEGKLVVACPLGKNDKTYRGIFILNVKTTEEAEALLQTDPAIKAKILDVEMYTWYGSAALPEYLKVHEKIEKQKH